MLSVPMTSISSVEMNMIANNFKVLMTLCFQIETVLKNFGSIFTMFADFPYKRNRYFQYLIMT